MQITDYTWSHPSKLFFATGIYLPGYKREDFRMIVAIDTSGSVSDKELNKALSEIYGIYDSHPSCELDILIGDTELKEHKKIYPGQRNEILAMKNKGGGGTSHKFVFDWIKNSNSNPNVLVLFTDGYSDIADCMDSIKPEYEVIFVWDKNFNNRIEGYGYKVTIGD
jgi:predicted metal-dependent peptidase